MLLGDAGALAVVARDASWSVLGPLLSSLRRVVPGAIDSDERAKGVPVFVMMPLDFALPSCPLDVKSALGRLAAAKVSGVMVDVWWGICEPKPGVYDFGKYKELMTICAELGLRVQATMSFHACGGNVGDDVNIPLPDWVVEAADEHGMWYVDRAGDINRECLSLGGDREAVLPGKVIAAASSIPPATMQTTEKVESPLDAGNGTSSALPAGDAPEAPQSAAKVTPGEGEPESESTPEEGEGTAPAPQPEPSVVEETQSTVAEPRTPLQAYRDFMTAFLEAMVRDVPADAPATLVELQVGCGPCGELRYPSYPMQGGKWVFPGMGEFICFDDRMRKALERTASELGHPTEWGVPPTDTGTYNGKPKDSIFFHSQYHTARAHFFMKWYADMLLEHGRSMLDIANAAIDDVSQGVSGNALSTRPVLAVKISGIHWWRLTRSRAAETTAGYYTCQQYRSYEAIAKMLASRNGILDFTCLEMRTIDQPFRKARCAPRQLVKEVFSIANRENVRVAGENALERYDWGAYSQILKAYRGVKKGNAYGFTFLRLGETLLDDNHFAVFERFVAEMAKL